MKKNSKRYNERLKLVDREKKYSLDQAIKIIKQIDKKKFDETVALSFQLGIKAANNEMVRGTVSLPHGTGKTVKIICFCKGEAAREAETAGADFVGAEELVKKVQEGWLEFDIVVAHPDMMREVSKLGKVLGPRKLMPSPKTGTVTPNIGRAVSELKAGRIEFKSDKTGGLHAPCGKISFPEKSLLENAQIIIKAVKEAKPIGSKGDYLKSAAITATQGPGVRLAVTTL
jgi:large subunit ribosomal protein L1